jgi:D-serine deaminase-like pyridoxal phosphate-dependent protein
MKLDEMTTPALLVDLDAMEANLAYMANFFADKLCNLRPHFKNHKAPMLARKQIRAGAIGITCATLREAEILVEQGIDSILIANEIAGDDKPERLADLSRQASVLVCVDNCHSVRDLAAAQRNRKSQIEVLVDINIGLNRCGVVPGQAVQPSPERDESVRQGSKAIVDSAMLLESAGIPAPIRSTGGTGTYAVSGDYLGITEIQAGSYLLMDNMYVSRGAPFQRSLTVLATVISTRGCDHVVLDCGVKAISGERDLPSLKDVSGARISALHAEHAIVELDPHSPSLTPGEKLQVWVHYSDATVNLHTKMFGVRHGEVEEVFPVEH